MQDPPCRREHEHRDGPDQKLITEFGVNLDQLAVRRIMFEPFTCIGGDRYEYQRDEGDGRWEDPEPAPSTRPQNGAENQNRRERNQHDNEMNEEWVSG